MRILRNIGSEGRRGQALLVIASEEADAEVFVSDFPDFVARKWAGDVAVNEQTEHHGGRVLYAAGAAVVDFRGAEIEQLRGIQHEMQDVISRHPVPQIWAVKALGGMIHGDETNCHSQGMIETWRILKHLLHPTGCSGDSKYPTIHIGSQLAQNWLIC